VDKTGQVGFYFSDTFERSFRTSKVLRNDTSNVRLER
jgi:hypothetical protein